MNLNNALLQEYATRFPHELATAIERSPAGIAELVNLPGKTLAGFLDRVDHLVLREVFLALPEEKQNDVLEVSSLRLSLTILRVLDNREREQVLERLTPLARDELTNLMSFAEDTAGYYMERPGAQFRGNDTVEETLTKIKNSEYERVRSIYVVDEDNKLLGRVDMQDIAFSEKQAYLSQLVKVVDEAVSLISHRDELVNIFERHRLDSVPVIDPEGCLIGVIRYASLFKAAAEEASADMQTMVGASADERALSSPIFAVKKRLPWLHINLLTAFLAAAVVGLFESTIAQFTALAILLPVVAGQSGNAGSQALAVTMRGLALKEISALQWRAVLAKEVQIGAIDGVALAFTCGLGVLVWSGSIGLALVIGIAMIVSMIAAGVSGALVPIILVRLGQDPATASSIILTTVTDVAGFMSFLGTATLLSSIL